MRRTPRIIGPASELPASERQCTCCGKTLRGKVAYLELDQRTGRYHDCGDIPVEQSQGWFPFGKTCAQHELERAAQVRD